MNEYNGKTKRVEDFCRDVKMRFVLNTDRSFGITNEGNIPIYGLSLKTAENLAKNNDIGLWKKSDHVCASCIKLIELEPIKDYFIIKNNCNIDCNLAGWEVKDDANHFTKLNDLPRGQEQAYQSKIEVWNDAGDRFFMRDEKGDLVIFYEYGNI